MIRRLLELDGEINGDVYKLNHSHFNNHLPTQEKTQKIIIYFFETEYEKIIMKLLAHEIHVHSELR